MYCSRCGNEIRDDQQFCDKCGQEAGARTEAPKVVYVSEKSAGVAAVLSFLFAGLGQIYVGKIMRGLAIIGAYMVFATVSVYYLLGEMINKPYGTIDDLGNLMWFILIISMISFVLLVWNVFDAYKLANEYNDHVRSTGNRPW